MSAIVLTPILNEYFDKTIDFKQFSFEVEQFKSFQHELVRHIYIRHEIDNHPDKSRVWAEKTLTELGEKSPSLKDEELIEYTSNLLARVFCEKLGAVKQQEKLDEKQILRLQFKAGDFSTKKMPPDGHCLFRSFAYSFLTSIMNNEAAKGGAILKLQAFLEKALECPEIMEAIPNLAQYITYFRRTIILEKDLNALFSDKKNTQALVIALRKIAAAKLYLEYKDHPETGEYQYADQSLPALDQLKAQMALIAQFEENAQLSTWGGAYEAASFARLFGVKIIVFSTEFIDPEFEGRDEIYKFIHEDEDLLEKPIALRKNGAHYDAITINEERLHEIEKLDLSGIRKICFSPGF